MSAAEALARISAKQGWNEQTQLELAMEYIGNQQSDEAFEDFLAQHAAEENSQARTR